MNDMLNEREAAKVLGVTPIIMQRWRQKGMGPRYIKYGETQQARIRYQRSDLEAYKNQHAVEPKGTQGDDSAGQ